VPRLILALAVLALLPASAQAAAWREITFDRTVQARDRAALDAAGATAVHPAGARRYLFFAGSATAQRLAARPGVRSVRRVRAAEKLVAGLSGGLATVVRAQGGRRVETVVRVGGALTPAALARRADVLHVGTVPLWMHPEDEGTDQLQAGNHADGKPKPGYEEWLAGFGANGTGSKIAIVDTGLDATHPDLEGRVTGRIDYELPAPVPTPLDVDEQGHGTHVAGIVAGNPDSEGLQAFRDDLGFFFGLGVAPGAELFAMNGIALTSPNLVPFIPTLTRDAFRSGSVAWNASWHTGEGTGAGYIETVRTIDSLARDADRDTPGNQPLTMVFSAGNEGSQEKTITVPKEAKNIITVGASKGQRASGNTEEMASFSSRGPALDGRIEPTISAPGETIASARSKPAGGLCFEPVVGGVSPIHSSCSGTSMASPHVAGAVALIAQWWRGFNGGANPSTAMTKALLVNSATDLDEPDVPNPNEGWGRVNVGTLFGTPPAARIHVDQADVLTDPGNARVMRVEAVDPAKPMRVTLVWTPRVPRPPTTTPRSARRSSTTSTSR
jgi:subtilisin family serine protease